ncbi:MAG: carboxypeptidase regulatory-like domain-containing protein [Thermoplasmata archaeon]|nr:carboxypeptidase regulatory-like domain-containing protein [Thermoplasmata archaeon]
MVQAETSWWRRHSWTIAVLLAAFGISFLIRTLYVLPLLTQWGTPYLFAGGSDSFYHWRVTSYILLNHRNLVVDPLLKYPIGAVNPREPLFDWMNAILGIVFAPLFASGATAACSSSCLSAQFFLELQAPLWAALGVFPVYLIGKEVSSRRMGLIAALLYGLVVASIDSSTFGYANYLSFYTFFILVALYSYLRTVRAAGSKRWVESYRHPRQFYPALRQFLRTERTAVKWAVFTGVAFGTVTLAWQGYSFLVAAIVIFLVVQMVIERIRKVDSFGLYVLTFISGTIGFAMALPYYYFQGLGKVWFFQPALVFFGAFLVLVPFLLLRDSPWVLSIPALLATAAVAVAALFVLDPQDFGAIVTGQGYFVKTLIYSTVAEAQAPSIDSLILGYGVVTFFLAFVGLGLYFWRTVRDRFRRVQVMFIVFAILSIYLPISAAKFFFIGSAGFALLPAEAIVRALDVGDYPTLRRNVVSLSDRRSQFAALRRSIKGRHLLVMALVVIILVPNVWYSIDAGIPYNNKGTYSTQVYNSLPVPLRTTPGNASSYYLGAAGTELDTPNQYDESGYNWLATQDTQLPEPQRPAFISWWDYGFQAAAEGDHPTVADNFQNGIDPAGNFLLSQNESQAIAILASTLLVGEQSRSGDIYLPSELNTILARDGVSVSTIHSLMVNQSADIQLVLAHPDRYLPVDPNNIDGQNAMYDTMAYYLATALPTSGVADLYNDVQAYTGWSIRYAMVDSRLFPFSGSNTGIFYAPADLTDRVIGAGGAPTSYYTLSVLGSDGNTYTPGNLPAGVTAVQYNINYLPAFYSSMIYRIYVGYNGTDIGSTQGIPGLSQNAVGADPIEPGWMLSHFQVVYRTAYYCPQPNATAGSSCFSAYNVPQARELAKLNNGTADTSTNSYFGGGEAMLEYYPGQPMTGTVTLPNGAPVSNARVTVYDSWGIPHMTTVTGADGSYSLVLPPGNDRINVTTGTLDQLTEAGGTPLAGFNITVPNALGLSLSAPTLVEPIVVKPATVSGFVYWNTANNSSFIRSVDGIVTGASANLTGANLTNLSAATDASGAFQFSNVPPGVYNFTIHYRGASFTQSSVYALPGKTANETIGLSPGTVLGHADFPDGFAAADATVTISDSLGVVRTATVGSNGNFTAANLGPGNYSVRAMAPGVSIGSVGTTFLVPETGGNVVVNLTLVPLVTVSEAVTWNGNPVVGFPVRFTQLFTPTAVQAGPPKTNGTPSASAPTAAKSNTSVFLTGPDGVVRATLPIANYSVYAFGLNGSRWLAGVQTVYLSAQSSGVLPALYVSNAVQLSGTVTGAPSTTAGPATVEVTAYDASGHQVSTFANLTQQYSLWLPTGRYTLLASSIIPNSSAPPVASLTTVDLAYPTVDPIALAPAEYVSGVVAAPSSGSSAPYPASGAVVRFTEMPLNATVTTVASGTGNVTVILPAVLPAGGSYCIVANASGFEPFQTCSYTAAELGALGEIPMNLAPIPLNFTVNGLPSGTSVTVNFTALSAPAASTVKVGGPSFSFAIVPGSYRISAWAKAPSGPGLLLPAQSLNLTVPVGTHGANVTLTIVPQVAATGHLVLPTGVLNTSVSLRLVSPTMALSVDGAMFEGKFYIAPGTYSVYATAPTGANGTLATMTSVVVNATGHLSKSISLTQLGVPLTGTLARDSGVQLNVSLPLTLTGPAGVALTVNANGGHFVATLPPNATYQVRGNATVLVPSPTGSVYQYVAVDPSYLGCVLGAESNASCTIPFVTTTVETNVSGTLHAAGFANPVAGTVQLIGPFPSTNATVATASNGTFSTAVIPGNYSLYAVASDGVPYASVSYLTVGPTMAAPLAVTLLSTWTDTVTVVPPSGSTETVATVTITAPGGADLSFPNEPVNTPVAFALPGGAYTVAARGSGNPYGVVVNATASSVVSLLSGNAATQLALAYQFTTSVDFATLGPADVTVPAGATVSFAFTITNTGNEPRNLTFVGSPAFWNFTFLPKSVQLGVLGANRTVGGEVRIVVPAGTSTLQPSVQLEAVDAVTKAPAGFAQPVPTISIVPVLGLSLGASSSIGATVGPYQVTIPFYASNTGNLPESTTFGVSDSARLASIGWTATVEKGTSPLLGPTPIAPGTNSTFQVELVSPAKQALPPGSVTVTAIVNNLTGGFTRTVVLNVPTVSVSLNNSTAIVTGPNLGSPSPYPSWLPSLLAIVPAAALAAVLVGYRWFKTRRWTRR